MTQIDKIYLKMIELFLLGIREYEENYKRMAKTCNCSIIDWWDLSMTTAKITLVNTLNGFQNKAEIKFRPASRAAQQAERSGSIFDRWFSLDTLLHAEYYWGMKIDSSPFSRSIEYYKYALLYPLGTLCSIDIQFIDLKCLQ